MHFKNETIQGLQKLHRNYGLKNDNDAIRQFPEELHDVLSKLSTILVSELELERSGYSDDKINRFLELAVLASKIIGKND